MSIDLDALVDLDRYPIHQLHTPAGLQLVERCSELLQHPGACELAGFLRDDAVTTILAEASEVRHHAHRTEEDHDLVFSGARPESLEPGDPRRHRIRTAKAGCPHDRLLGDSLLRHLHTHPTVVAFVAATLDVADLIPSTDPMGAINIMYYGPGDELGWHFDRSDFVVTLMLQQSAGGGHFEFAPMIRTESDERWSDVDALLEGDRSRVQVLDPTPGTLSLFRGHWSAHRVTPVDGVIDRINVTLSFDRGVSKHLSPHQWDLFYGRRPDPL